MMGVVRRIAHAVRQAPGLRGATWLWRIGRAPYYRLLSSATKGVPVSVGPSCVLRIPAEFCGANWEAYEATAVRRMATWLESTPNALVLDVGCEAGFYSLLTLSAGLGARVIGFDPDRASLKKTQMMCRFVAFSRLRLVHGFLSEHHESGATVDVATETTVGVLEGNEWRRDDNRSSYMGLDVDEGKDIPTHSLDGLAIPVGRRPVLLKCDVEGAELLVLKGGRDLLQSAKPTLLISVHPEFLPKFGHSAADVTDFLESLGYQIEILGIDHEEHWWCEPLEVKARG